MLVRILSLIMMAIIGLPAIAEDRTFGEALSAVEYQLDRQYLLISKPPESVGIHPSDVNVMVLRGHVEKTIPSELGALDAQEDNLYRVDQAYGEGMVIKELGAVEEDRQVASMLLHEYEGSVAGVEAQLSPLVVETSSPSEKQVEDLERLIELSPIFQIAD